MDTARFLPPPSLIMAHARSEIRNTALRPWLRYRLSAGRGVSEDTLHYGRTLSVKYHWSTSEKRKKKVRFIFMYMLI